MNRKQLEQLDQKCLYEVYDDEQETNDFRVGYIRAIFKVQQDTQYLKPYQNLNRPHEQIPELSEDSDTLLNFLEWTKKNNKLVEIMTVWDELIIGTIETIEENLVMLNTVAPEEFQSDGKCFIECDNIVDICIDTARLKFITT
ncbi:hypothetical protein ABW380_000654 [Listeria innocua]|nr:hypothetical protein [Listeria innocua]EDO1168024.1 hypothetical protein [Listeria innocua]EHF3609817.1 hypothetical protein [Listeria innocua]EIB7771433.1 hypothetical protein [Listeria innocua]EKM1397480.1 hypothetical protein [Listeria innocua]